jgi:transcriptional antiterminator Rof (Rho-off)
LADDTRALKQKAETSDLPADQKDKETQTRINEIKEYEQKALNATTDGETKINATRAKLQADQTKRLEDNLKNAEKVATDAEKLRIDKITALGQQGLISATEVEKRREAIENGAITRQRSTLEIYNNSPVQAKARAAVAAKAQALDAQASALAEEQKNRRLAANKQEFEDGVRLQERQLQVEAETCAPLPPTSTPKLKTNLKLIVMLNLKLSRCRMFYSIKK